MFILKSKLVPLSKINDKARYVIRRCYLVIQMSDPNKISFTSRHHPLKYGHFRLQQTETVTAKLEALKQLPTNQWVASGWVMYRIE